MNFHIAKITGACAAFAVGWLISTPNAAHAESNLLKTAGTLTCVTKGGTSYLKADGVDMSCTYEPTSLEQQPVYFRGKVNQTKAKPLGRAKTLIVWQVLSSANQLTAKDIEGSYETLSVEQALPTASAGLIQRSELDVVLRPITRGVRADDDSDSTFDVIEIQLSRRPVSA